MSGITLSKSNFISTKTTPISKEYILGKTLGKGAFGTVRLCIHKQTKQTRACKVLKKSTQDMEALFQEVEILSKLSHPNIMQIYEVFNDKTNFYIISEYCQGGELFDAISKRGFFSEYDASYIMKQVLSAICYSHQNNIVHRDLKPENILLDAKDNDLTVKIIDWGCAKTVKKDEKMDSIDGTLYYIAPEVLNGESDKKSDVWSCGVILYILLCGYFPFNGDNDDQIVEAIKSGKVNFIKDEWKHISNDAKELIQKMLEINPNNRFDALECLNHNFFNKKKDKGKKNDVKATKKVLDNMKKFKRERKLEQAAIGFIVNQLVSKEERKELSKLFQDFDTNHDGVLSREEIINGYRRTYGAVDENEIDNMIRSIDLDGNGVIDYNEFLSCTINKEKIINKENLEYTFKMFDSDGSGKISADELMNIFLKGNKDNAVNREAFEKMIKEVDENGDGEISFQEFKGIMTKFFK